MLEPACATYDLPRAAAEDLGLPATAAHPQAHTHHLGLYFMASRGAVLASELEVDPAKLTRVLHFDGTPITARFISDAIADNVGSLKIVPLRKAVP